MNGKSCLWNCEAAKELEKENSELRVLVGKVAAIKCDPQHLFLKELVEEAKRYRRRLAIELEVNQVWLKINGLKDKIIAIYNNEVAYIREGQSNILVQTKEEFELTIAMRVDESKDVVLTRST